MIQFLFFEFAFTLVVGASAFTILYFESMKKKTSLLKDAFLFDLTYFLAILVVGIGEYSVAFRVHIPSWVDIASIFVQLTIVCVRSVFMIRMAHGFLGRRPSACGMRVFAYGSLSVPVLFLVAVARMLLGDASWRATTDFGRVLMNAYVFPTTIGCAVFLLANRRSVVPGLERLVTSFVVIAFLVVPLFVFFNSLGAFFPGALSPDISMLGFFLLNASFVFLYLRRAIVGAHHAVKKASLIIPQERLATSHGVSKREYEILALVIQGMTNTQIAKKLFLSPHTVRNHIYNAYQKLKVDNRIQLIKSLTE